MPAQQNSFVVLERVDERSAAAAADPWSERVLQMTRAIRAASPERRKALEDELLAFMSRQVQWSLTDS